jgi:hypothetical protein
MKIKIICPSDLDLNNFLLVFQSNTFFNKIIYIDRTIIELFSIQEIKCIIFHEIGHIIYKHNLKLNLIKFTFLLLPFIDYFKIYFEKQADKFALQFFDNKIYFNTIKKLIDYNCNDFYKIKNDYRFY